MKIGVKVLCIISSDAKKTFSKIPSIKGREDKHLKIPDFIVFFQQVKNFSTFIV